MPFRLLYQHSINVYLSVRFADFMPEPIETSIRSSAKRRAPEAHESQPLWQKSNSPTDAVKSPADHIEVTSKGRRFSPQPVEESTRTSRKFKPEPIETTSRSRHSKSRRKLRQTTSRILQALRQRLDQQARPNTCPQICSSACGDDDQKLEEVRARTCRDKPKKQASSLRRDNTDTAAPAEEKVAT